MERVANEGDRTGFLERMAERLGGSADVRTVFGEPIERNGRTVVPVAKARWGFGGGNGDREGASGGGGGGGMVVSPVGYLEIRDDRTKYRPVLDPGSVSGVLLAGALGLILAGLLLGTR